MQWMISHQDARRNLSPGELIYANSMVTEEIALENKEKQLSMLKQNQTNNRSVQMDKTGKDEKFHTSHTHTREQVAKMSGGGTGTVARYDAIMKTDEAKQRKVAVEYVKLCGYKNGEMGKGRKKECQLGTPTLLSLDEIASQLGTSKRNLQRALTIERNLTEPMKQLLDDGVISKTNQQRKLENVLKNWKGCMGYNMVEIMEINIQRQNRIIRTCQNPNQI